MLFILLCDSVYIVINNLIDLFYKISFCELVNHEEERIGFKTYNKSDSFEAGDAIEPPKVIMREIGCYDFFSYLYLYLKMMK